MFGFSWTEIGIIMAVALIFIGPKDMPVAIRTVTAMMKKARGMAAEFQTHVDDMMREANLAEVKTEFNKIRKFDFKGAVEKQIDPDGGLKNVMTQTAAAATAATATAVKAPVVEVEEPAPDSPPFIPPEAARSKRVPDFIPPGTKRWGF
jgi:sec-independent protein translocase protein TatB